MRKKKPTDTPSSPIALNIQPPKPAGGFLAGLGSLFKGSVDQVAQLKEAQELIEKHARSAENGMGRADARRQSEGKQTSPAPPTPAPPPTPTPTPTLPVRPAQAQPGPVAAPPRPAAPNPTAPTQPPANPGYVHPARMQGGDPWARSRATPSNDANGYDGRNPNILGVGGYNPGANTLWQHADPQEVANFVQGGGTFDQPDSGYGGQFGAVTRFGSLLDYNATNALTNRSPYVRGHYNYQDPERIVEGENYPGQPGQPGHPGVPMFPGHPGLGGFPPDFWPGGDSGVPENPGAPAADKPAPAPGDGTLSFGKVMNVVKDNPVTSGVAATAAATYAGVKGYQALKGTKTPTPSVSTPGAPRTWGQFGKSTAKSALPLIATLGVMGGNRLGLFGEQNQQTIEEGVQTGFNTLMLKDLALKRSPIVATLFDVGKNLLDYGSAYAEGGAQGIADRARQNSNSWMKGMARNAERVSNAFNSPLGAAQGAVDLLSTVYNPATNAAFVADGSAQLVGAHNELKNEGRMQFQQGKTLQERVDEVNRLSNDAHAGLRYDVLTQPSKTWGGFFSNWLDEGPYSVFERYALNYLNDKRRAGAAVTDATPKSLGNDELARYLVRDRADRLSDHQKQRAEEFYKNITTVPADTLPADRQIEALQSNVQAGDTLLRYASGTHRPALEAAMKKVRERLSYVQGEHNRLQAARNAMADAWDADKKKQGWTQIAGTWHPPVSAPSALSTPTSMFPRLDTGNPVPTITVPMKDGKPDSSALPTTFPSVPSTNTMPSLGGMTYNPFRPSPPALLQSSGQQGEPINLNY